MKQDYYNRVMNSDFRETLYNFEPVSDKTVNSYLYELKPIPHYEEEYEKKLKSKEHQCVNLQVEKVQKIFNKRPLAQPLNPASQICQCCFEEIMGRSRKWCRVCGSSTCKSCLVRKRVMVTGETVDYCQQCDKAFLEAMEAKQSIDEYRKVNQAFLKLAQEQQMTEKLLRIERSKSKDVGEESDNELLKLARVIINARAENRNLELELVELKRKIEWGSEVNEHLKNKERKAKKMHENSFHSFTQGDDELFEPPRANSSAISIENLNESLINSILETENAPEQTTPEPRKCSLDSCRLF